MPHVIVTAAWIRDRIAHLADERATLEDRIRRLDVEVDIWSAWTHAPPVGPWIEATGNAATQPSVSQLPAEQAPLVRPAAGDLQVAGVDPSGMGGSGAGAASPAATPSAPSGPYMAQDAGLSVTDGPRAEA